MRLPVEYAIGARTGIELRREARAKFTHFCDDAGSWWSCGTTATRLVTDARERKERPLAGNKRPSFLKRQKEQARLARANEKRELRRARRLAKSEATELPEAEEFEVMDGPAEIIDEEQESGL